MEQEHDPRETTMDKFSSNGDELEKITKLKKKPVLSKGM